MKCKIENCDKEILASGYCSMHYARNRRTGDPNIIQKRGRKKNKFREFTLQSFSDKSKRTVDKLLRFYRIASEIGISESEKEKLTKQAVRSNGTFSFEKLNQIADLLLIKSWIKKD
ncbi:MAG: hypothetical protein EVJ46_07425 [Candidatus Acididesulfobacter guangdongensis]|uniref:Uncharacterized protein n=1 Tax=Acididesulfobacter guangdongensis TaxID=2597225 RepID=A0A519BFH4_ACIG2|nr:MAG: hypothetical protein EVJ46_07425 [Candidatus Acididesulfobacter guangdongensis]